MVYGMKELCMVELPGEQRVENLWTKTVFIIYPENDMPVMAGTNVVVGNVDKNNRLVRIVVSTGGLAIQEQYLKMLIERFGRPDSRYYSGSIQALWYGSATKDGIVFVGENKGGLGMFVVTSQRAYRPTSRRSGTPF